MFFATAAAMGGNQMRQVGQGHPLLDSQELPLEELKPEAWRLLKSAEGNADPIAAVGAAAALLLALHARDATGSGQSVLTTMICSDIYANSDEAIAYEGRPQAPRVDADLMGLGPLYRLYEASSGWTFLACLRRKEWLAFCEAVGRPDLAPQWEAAWQVDGSHAGGELGSAIADIMRSRSAAEWEALMAERDVPLVAVELRDPGRFNVQDEEMRLLGHAVPVESPVHGKDWRHGALQQFSADGLTLGGWEALGGHTLAVLSELGYSQQEIQKLIREGVAEVWSADGA
jgi:crotonobetainyl-CoA:carnitine CoA-transferase CaiB-like acyl-CoA transferase